MTITHLSANYAGDADLTANTTSITLPFNELVGGAAWTATPGRVLWLMVAADKSVTAFNDPSGWTPINKYVSANVSLGVWYMVAQGGESTVTVTTTAGTRFMGACAFEEDSITALGMVSVSDDSGTSDVDHLASGSVNPGRPALAIAVVATDSTTPWGGINGQPTWSDSYARIAGQDDTGTPSSNTGFPGWSVATKLVSGSTSVDPDWSPNFDQAAITLAVFPLRLALPPARGPRLPFAILAR